VLKSLTSALIGRFVVAAESATVQRWGSGPLVRYDADLEVPDATRDEITVLKSVAAHYVMRADDRAEHLGSQRDLLQGLVKALVASEGRDLEPDIRADHDAAPDDAGRLRAVIDQVAGLTDISAPLWADRLGV
jgi:dGTPase